MVREKSGKNEKFSRSGKSQVKIFDIVKVSEKSGNSIFRFIVSFLQDFEMHFLLEKMKSMTLL